MVHAGRGRNRSRRSRRDREGGRLNASVFAGSDLLGGIETLVVSFFKQGI